MIYFGITLGYVLVTGPGAGLGYFIGYIGNDPGAYTDARLDKLSRKFRGLKERADTWTADEKPAAQAPLAS